MVNNGPSWFEYREVYSMQYYVIQFVSDLFGFPPPIKLIVKI